MKKILVAGITGMLGSEVFAELQKENFNVTGTTRKELDAQNATQKDIENLLCGIDYVINCIGIIKPYIHDNNSHEVQTAIKINALFPHILAAAAENTETRVIQIATDCVYDGKTGSYSESSLHNPTDVYGKTKSLGEVYSPNVMNLRCSIIGKEKKSYLSLLEWFLHRPENAEVNGFKNHVWNGVTTKAFADICSGIIKNDFPLSGVQHVVPSDKVSKAQMLHIFADAFDRNDVIINDINAKESIDRTLSTDNKEVNEKLWKLAGYSKIPTVGYMIREIKELS